jgi:TolB protein
MQLREPQSWPSSSPPSSPAAGEEGVPFPPLPSQPERGPGGEGLVPLFEEPTSLVFQQPALNRHRRCNTALALVKLQLLFLKNMLRLMFVLLLAGCASAAATATPTPALGPLPTLSAEPTARPIGPAPTIAAQGLALPGRMLFVQGGNLWLWQGDAGRQLTSNGDTFQPAWSPEGGRIAYIQRVTSFSELLVMPSEGGEAVQLTQDGPDSSVYSYERIYASMWAFYPAWSPDGATIAFASQAGPPGGSPAAEFRVSLFSTPAEAGSERTQLYADASGHVGRLAYAPDGQSIAFAFGPAHEGEPTIYRYIVESGNAEPFPGAPAQSYDPAFSPDGTLLAFAARINGRTDVFVIRTTTAAASAEDAPAIDTEATPTTSAAAETPIQLTSIGTARAPAFSPDGKQLAFLAIAPGGNSFDLWVLDLEIEADGALVPGQPRQITQGMALDADSGVAWGK